MPSQLLKLLLVVGALYLAFSTSRIANAEVYRVTTFNTAPPGGDDSVEAKMTADCGILVLEFKQTKITGKCFPLLGYAGSSIFVNGQNERDGEIELTFHSSGRPIKLKFLKRVTESRINWQSIEDDSHQRCLP